MRRPVVSVAHLLVLEVLERREHATAEVVAEELECSVRVAMGLLADLEAAGLVIGSLRQ
jgi:HTH domain